MMTIEKIKPKNIDEYIVDFPEIAKQKLEEIRRIITLAAPTAEETISYNMPAFKLNGILAYFAAYKNHIGFYPTGSGIANFEDRFANYKYSKGAVQFPLDKNLPADLITEIIKFRVEENSIKIAKKKNTI